MSSSMVAPSVGHPVLSRLAELRAGVAELGQGNLWSLSDAESLQALLALEGLRRQLDAVLVRHVAEVEGRRAAVAEGATSTAAWLRHRLGMRPAEAGALVRLAAGADTAAPAGASGSGAVAGIAPTVAALGEARVALAHARVIEATLRRLPGSVGAEERARGQALLVEQAGWLDPDQLARVGLHLRHVLDPAGVDGEEEAALTHRALYAATVAGRVLLRGELDLAGGEAVLTVLNALTAPPTAADAADPDAARRPRPGAEPMRWLPSPSGPWPPANCPPAAGNAPTSSSPPAGTPCAINSRTPPARQPAARVARRPGPVPSPPPLCAPSPATPPCSPPSSAAPGKFSTTAALPASFPARCAAPWPYATAAACSPAATGRPQGDATYG